jgi:RNA polymerase sigma-70 factor (sigma-E family)
MPCNVATPRGVLGRVEVMTALTYDELVVARAPALLRLAVMLTGRTDEGEELLQRTFLRAQRHAERIAGMGAPAAYLRQVMVNEHLSGLRLLHRRPQTDGDAELAGLASPDQHGRVESHDQAWRALATLPRKQRAVLVLRFYEDLPDREIASLLGCTEGTVRSQAHRGLATLRTRLTDPSEVTP